MKNEVIPLDRLVINAGTSAGEEDVRAHVCVCVCVSEADKLLSRRPSV